MLTKKLNKEQAEIEGRAKTPIGRVLEVFQNDGRWRTYQDMSYKLPDIPAPQMRQAIRALRNQRKLISVTSKSSNVPSMFRCAEGE